MNHSKRLAICLFACLFAACQSNPSASSVSSKQESSQSSTQVNSSSSASSSKSSKEASSSVVEDTPITEDQPISEDTSVVEQTQEYTVLEALQNGEQLAAQSSLITVVGFLPQAANIDENGQYFAVILNSPDSNTPQDRIRLEGSINFGGCKARITGNFFYNDNGEPCLQIVEAQQI